MSLSYSSTDHTCLAAPATDCRDRPPAGHYRPRYDRKYLSNICRRPQCPPGPRYHLDSTGLLPRRSSFPPLWRRPERSSIARSGPDSILLTHTDGFGTCRWLSLRRLRSNRFLIPRGGSRIRLLHTFHSLEKHVEIVARGGWLGLWPDVREHPPLLGLRFWRFWFGVGLGQLWLRSPVRLRRLRLWLRLRRFGFRQLGLRLNPWRVRLWLGFG